MNAIVFLKRLFAAVLLCSSTLFAGTSVKIFPADPTTIYYADENPEFRGGKNMKWVLTDWRGNKLREGSFDANGQLRLAFLPSGYYELRAQNEKEPLVCTFAVVPHRKTSDRNPNMFFAVDTGMSWMNPVIFPLTAEAARRSGLTIVRDRFAWPHCERTPGKYDFSYYLKTTNEFKKRDIRISNILHGAPSHAKEKNKSLPTELDKVYSVSRELARAFKGRVTAWEFWNEEDIGFSLEGAWDYSAAMKAAYLGFKAGDRDLQVVLGAFAQISLPAYCDVVFENGIKEYIDVFNMHTYNALNSYPGDFMQIHKFMKKHGIENRPLWFTEIGTDAEGSGRIQRKGSPNKDHDRDQELIVAELLPKQMLEMQFQGVDRCFWFILPPYYENGGSKVWGLMRDDLSVKPAYCAFAALTENLGSAEIEGELKIGNGLKAFLYRQKNGKQTLVYWQRTLLETEGHHPNTKFIEPPARKFQLKVPAGTYSGTTIFSTPFTAESTNGVLTLKAERFVNYIHGLSGLKADIPAWKTAKKIAAENQKTDRTVIYQFKPEKTFRLMDAKNAVELKGKSGTFDLVIWNLSSAVKTGNITVSGCRTEKLPGKIELKPFSKAVVQLKVTPNFKDGTARIVVTGSFNGKKTTPLVVPVIDPEKMAASAKIVKRFLHMEDPANWKKNASGKMSVSYNDKDSAVVFDVTFPPKTGRWVYPIYPLQLPQESLKGAKFISFEWKIETKKSVGTALLMCNTKDQNGKKRNVWLNISRETGKWVKNVVPMNQQNLNPADIVALQIGLNPSEDKIRYSIRNINVLY